MSVATRADARNDSLAPMPWPKIVRTVLQSRALDRLEETKLLPAREILYQFSAHGHDVTQAIMAELLDQKHDAVSAYYRSRPLALGLGLSIDQALAATMMRAESMSGGRDIGVVFNLPSDEGPCILPVCGGVGTQYTPAVGWAQSLIYRSDTLKDPSAKNSIAVAHGGDGSIATNGFWSALNIATTLRLPILFFIEDNGYGISVPAHMQTPHGNIAANLGSFGNLTIFEADSRSAASMVNTMSAATAAVRARHGPALLRITLPRLSGHSGQDTQSYKSSQQLADEQRRDPLVSLRQHLVPEIISNSAWEALEQEAANDVATAYAAVAGLPSPAINNVTRHVFSERRDDGSMDVQIQGGLHAAGIALIPGCPEPRPSGPRINMLSAIRRTLEHELSINPLMLVFGEDVGIKGGVHAATMGLQEKFGAARVFDTSLSEEGIIGRAVGMALAGLLPVPEIQFRKYADPATEQLNDCGTMRWRTSNRFAAPMVVRMPGGFFKCGDPWHSQSNEVQFVHAIGWRLAMPSNAEDAVGLLRAALRGNDPVIFFEHRALLDGVSARRPYPGDDYILPFGMARIVRPGNELTLVTWGAMVERCERAAAECAVDVEIIDMRTLSPWDRGAVMESVAKTRRCLIVHEDNITAGFGAEISACIASEAFASLDAPPQRLAMPDIPSPHSPVLLDAVLPSVAGITAAIHSIASY